MKSLNSFDAIKAYSIANSTSNAYSYDAYGQGEWVRCILFLKEEGYNDEAIIYILRSKHMRWARDSFDATASGFMMYYSGRKGAINRMLRDDGLNSYIDTGLFGS